MKSAFQLERAFFRTAIVACALPAGVSSATVAGAQEHLGAPPPDAEAIVSAPAATAESPAAAQEATDGTTASASAGAMLSTGNSRQLAASANGGIETRFGANGLGASLLGNYGRSAPADEPLETTAENVQGRIRYDRYLLERLSLFVINTGRHDRFQGLDFRYNLDPGVKYVFLQGPSSLWGELGYDFQYDIRRDEALAILDADGDPVVDPATDEPARLDKTQTDHSGRVFVGFNHSFNEEVTLSTGLEYLQSLVETERARVNFDALLAAKLGGGLAFGVGFGARFDNAPLPGKEELDTATTVNLIYAFSNLTEPPPP